LRAPLCPSRGGTRIVSVSAGGHKGRPYGPGLTSPNCVNNLLRNDIRATSSASGRGPAKQVGDGEHGHDQVLVRIVHEAGLELLDGPAVVDEPAVRRVAGVTIEG